MSCATFCRIRLYYRWKLLVHRQGWQASYCRLFQRTDATFRYPILHYMSINECLRITAVAAWSENHALLYYSSSYLGHIWVDSQLYFLFRLGYTCCYNKQMIDNTFLEARGQSASCSGQLVTKIEASFRGWKNKFPACPLLLILGFKYDTDKNYITPVD